uniref:Leishmanolysin-like peptidase n=1 Tax=Schistosoma haematobium TaxID=6185 RepID=A0A095AX73_SCHHA
MKIIVVITILLVLLSSVESARRCKVAESRKPNAIESASSYWERALVVNVDKQESLLVRRECVKNRLTIPGKEKQTYCDVVGCEQSQECYEFKIPNDYLSACYQQKSNKNVLVFPEGKGIAPNELVLFVKNVYFGVCDEYVVAWASFCDRDPTNGRQVILIDHLPFVGIVNFCPSVDDILKTEDYDLILTAKHELGHVLGFHADIFSSLPRLKPEFRLSNNDPSPIQNITIKWKSARGVFNIQKTIMRLPNMISEAQKHFGCNEIPGIPLDSNHLSHRVMGNDILTPNRLESNLVSRILLAYFKDTKKQDIQPFCDTPWEKRCINYDRAIGRCSLFDSETELPLHFQYADNSFNVPREKQTYYSGPDIYDYCPVYEEALRCKQYITERIKLIKQDEFDLNGLGQHYSFKFAHAHYEHLWFMAFDIFKFLMISDNFYNGFE